MVKWLNCCARSCACVCENFILDTHRAQLVGRNTSSQRCVRSLSHTHAHAHSTLSHYYMGCSEAERPQSLPVTSSGLHILSSASLRVCEEKEWWRCYWLWWVERDYTWWLLRVPRDVHFRHSSPKPSKGSRLNCKKIVPRCYCIGRWVCKCW